MRAPFWPLLEPTVVSAEPFLRLSEDLCLFTTSWLEELKLSEAWRFMAGMLMTLDPDDLTMKCQDIKVQEELLANSTAYVEILADDNINFCCRRALKVNASKFGALEVRVRTNDHPGAIPYRRSRSTHLFLPCGRQPRIPFFKFRSDSSLCLSRPTGSVATILKFSPKLRTAAMIASQ